MDPGAQRGGEMLIAMEEEYGEEPVCVAPRASAENDSGPPNEPGWKPECGFDEGEWPGGNLGVSVRLGCVYWVGCEGFRLKLDTGQGGGREGAPGTQNPTVIVGSPFRVARIH
jgi:hypothetical protein